MASSIDPKLKNTLRKIFNKHDPIGIYCSRNINFDEYDPEIKEVLVRFRKDANLENFTSQVHKVFQKMFGQELAGNKTRYRQLAKEINTLLLQE